MRGRRCGDGNTVNAVHGEDELWAFVYNVVLPVFQQSLPVG